MAGPGRAGFPASHPLQCHKNFLIVKFLPFLCQFRFDFTFIVLLENERKLPNLLTCVPEKVHFNA